MIDISTYDLVDLKHFTENTYECRPPGDYLNTKIWLFDYILSEQRWRQDILEVWILGWHKTIFWCQFHLTTKIFYKTIFKTHQLLSLSNVWKRVMAQLAVSCLDNIVYQRVKVSTFGRPNEILAKISTCVPNKIKLLHFNIQCRPERLSSSHLLASK